MQPMSPRLVRFAKPADAWLREHAGRLGIPVTELIRRIVDDRREQEGAGAVGDHPKREDPWGE